MLAQLNDTVILEAARASALAVDKPGRGEAEVATEMFRRCVVRPPESGELAAILDFYHAQLTTLTATNPLLVLNAGPQLNWQLEPDQVEWQAAQDCVLAYQGGRMIVTSQGVDPQLRANIDFPAGPATLTLRAKFSNLEPCEIFWTTTADRQESVEQMPGSTSTTRNLPTIR